MATWRASTHRHRHQHRGAIVAAAALLPPAELALSPVTAVSATVPVVLAELTPEPGDRGTSV